MYILNTLRNGECTYCTLLEMVNVLYTLRNGECTVLYTVINGEYIVHS